MPTQSEQVREAITVSDVLKYKITATVTDKGDLPTDALLVIAINVETDSKEDTFGRVATIADFTEVQADRVAAIAADEDVYRAVAFTLYYDNIETANNAQKLIKEKIDELVTDYAVYQSEFQAVVAETTEHPQVGESTYDAAVTAYQDALRDQADAEETRDTASEDYVDKQAECVITTSIAVKAQEVADDCTATKEYFDTLRVKFIALDTDGDAILAAAQVYYAAKVATVPDGDDITFLAAITAFISALQTSTAGIATAAGNAGTFGVICGKRATENGTAQEAKATCDTEQAAARTAFEDAQAAVEVATQATNAALAAVQALKPSFDPTSVEATPAES